MTGLFSALYRVYDSDRQLMEQLGLDPIRSFPHGEWVKLGTVRVGEVEVEVEVNMMPAHFWRFTLRMPDRRNEMMHVDYVISTGSGSFSTYWRKVKRAAEWKVALDRLR